MKNTFHVMNIFLETLKEVYNVNLFVDQEHRIILDEKNHVFVNPFEIESLTHFYVRAQFSDNLSYIQIFDKFFPQTIRKRFIEKYQEYIRNNNSKKYLVAWLDILGFKDHISSDVNRLAIFPAFDNYKEPLKNIFINVDSAPLVFKPTVTHENIKDILPPNTPKDLLYILQQVLSKDALISLLTKILFSLNDNNSDYLSVIDIRLLSDGIFVKANVENAGKFLQTISSIFLNCFHHGILIRGAITIGQCFIDQDFLFSEALSNAYVAERDLAKYPRIILDEVTLNAIPSNVRDRLIVKDDDYCRIFWEDTLVSTSIITEANNLHKPYFIPTIIEYIATVNRRIDLYKNDSRVKPKYEYMLKQLLQLQKDYPALKDKINNIWKQTQCLYVK